MFSVHPQADEHSLRPDRPFRGPESRRRKTNSSVPGMPSSVRFFEGEPTKMRCLFLALSREKEKRAPRLNSKRTAEKVEDTVQLMDRIPLGAHFQHWI